MFKKLLLSFLALFFVTFTFLTFSLTKYSHDIITQDMMDAYQVSAAGIAAQCDAYVSSVQDDLLSSAVHPLLQAQLWNFSEKAKLSGDEDIYYEFEPAPSDSLSKILIFPMDDSHLYLETSPHLYQKHGWNPDTLWAQKTRDRNGRLNLSIIEVNGAKYIRISMLITDTSDWQTALGIIAADIPIDSFLISIGKVSLDSSDYMILVDDAGTTQYPYLTNALIEKSALQKTIANESSTSDHFASFSHQILHSNWHLIVAFSTSQIQERASNMYRSLFVYALIAIVIFIIIAFIISRQMSHPVVTLARHIQNADYFEKISVPGTLIPEYQTLYVNYNNMVEKINELIEKLYTSSKKERETQLRMLQAQLNPHFIYNVLDSINWMAMKYKANDIQMMVTSLATMLRCSLNSGQDILPVHREIQQIKSYLAIQAYRYDDDIQITYDFGEEIMNQKIIKLLLQPLVENALIHGLETSEREKRLIISGHMQDELLVFEVRNNGNLPDLERLAHILAGDGQVTSSYGIRNVNERIKTTYGDAYGLSYYIQNEWIIANITVPSKPI